MTIICLQTFFAFICYVTTSPATQLSTVLLLIRPAYPQESACAPGAPTGLCSGLITCNPTVIGYCGLFSLATCTKITHTFLFKTAVTATGKPSNYDPSSTSPIYVCRPYEFQQTLINIIVKFALKFSDVCDPSTESRLLSDERREQTFYVNSLKKRIEQLEDIAHRSSINSQMCKLHELERCQAQYGGVGKCTCYNRIQPLTPTDGTVSCLINGAQGNLCGSAVKYDSTTGASSDPVFPDGYINNNKVHLPDSLAAPKTIKCLRVTGVPSADSPPYDLLCSSTDVGICVCPEDHIGRGDDCSQGGVGSRSTSLAFTYETKHTGLEGSMQALRNLDTQLALLESRMTLNSHGDGCSATQRLQAGLPDLWKWMDELQRDGLKTEMDIQMKRAEVQRIRLGRPRGAFCGFKRVDGKVERHPNTNFPIRLHCQLDPSSTDRKYYCVHTLFAQESYITDVLNQVPRKQVPKDLDPGASSNCDVAAQNHLSSLLIQAERRVGRGEMANPNDPDLIKFKFDLIDLKTMFGESQLCKSIDYPGLYCVEGKCTCGDGTHISDYVWSDSQSKCLLKFGRPCKECRPVTEVKPILYVTCRGPELECEDGALCTNVYGYPPDSRICVRVKPLPAPPLPKNGAAVLSVSGMFIVSMLLYSFEY